MRKVHFYGPAICLTLSLNLFAQTSKPVSDAKKYKGEVALANFDTTVKPQDNFYEYVNGNWLKNNPIPATEAAWGSFNVLNDSIVHRLRTILNTAAAKKDAQHGSVEQKIG
ncbi:MAG TPA: M13 family metallopeptidase N-terminal domain-containing protein, partial [Bacteroidia bacterium]|nr:M13 family metallopeptidase N-terminal domain-containing protein [Bacteroidia bacterium]